MSHLVRVHLVLRPGESLPPRESLWARPDGAVGTGGTYVLESNSSLVALAAGDRVRAELNAEGQLQVVDIVAPADALLTGFAVGRELPPTDVEGMVERWRAAGAAWTEGAEGLLTTTWPGKDEEAVTPILDADQRAGRGQWVFAAGPADRGRAAQDEIELELDRAPLVEG